MPALPENTDSCLISHHLETVPLFLKNRYAFISKHTVLAGAQWEHDQRC